MYTRKITHWFARRSFQNRIFLLILFTSTIVMLAMSWYLTSITEEPALSGRAAGADSGDADLGDA
jgi:sensor histidine kinase regulating citrate/malate metabolism